MRKARSAEAPPKMKRLRKTKQPARATSIKGGAVSETSTHPLRQESSRLNLLFVCTGNICRSPMAAAMAEALLKSRVPGLSVHSTGRLSAGRAPTAPMLEVMSKRGFDLRTHVSTTLDSALDGAPDIVIGMAREHVRDVVDHRPSLFERTFTLKELVRLAAHAGPRLPGEELVAYLRRAGAGRKISTLIGTSPRDDIADPIGGPVEDYERCAAEIEGLVSMLADYLWPSSSLRR
jgi:protein-tyrosine-phosphatase